MGYYFFPYNSDNSNNMHMLQPTPKIVRIVTDLRQCIHHTIFTWQMESNAQVFVNATFGLLPTLYVVLLRFPFCNMPNLAFFWMFIFKFQLGAGFKNLLDVFFLVLFHDSVKPISDTACDAEQFIWDDVFNVFCALAHALHNRTLLHRQ